MNDKLYTLTLTVANVIPYGGFAEVLFDYNYIQNKQYKLRSTIELDQIYPKITNITDLVGHQVNLTFKAQISFMDDLINLTESTISQINTINNVIKVDILN